MKPYKYRNKILKGQEGLTLIMGNPDRDEMLTYSDSKGNIVTKPNVKAGFVSGTDPVGETYVSGIAMNPVFKAVGNSILYGLGKLGNTWARAKIVSKNLLNGKYNNIDNTKPGLSLGRRQYIARRFFNWENPNVMYHTPVGKSRFTRNGLIPGKSFDSNEDYLWWSENIPWSTNRTVFSIPKDKAKVVAKGNVSGINKEDAMYPLTKEVPLEELTSYDYNPITYQIEKSIYVNPKSSLDLSKTYQFSK